MPDFEELKRRYMVQGTVSSLGGASPPSVPTFQNCHVTHHINGPDYFPALKAKINTLAGGAGQFIYLMGWWLDPGFSLDGAGGGTTVVDLLKAKSRAGVDVRVLGWVMAPQVLQNPALASLGFAADILNLNAETARFIQALRAEPTLADKAVLNILSHPAGSVHIKGGIVGDGTDAAMFTGGLDLQQGRWQPFWHDVEAQVRGPAVQALFDAFRDMWGEIKRRPVAHLTITPPSGTAVTLDSHSTGMPDLPARSLGTATTSKMHVQSGLTLPQFNIATISSLFGGGNQLPSNAPLSYAPSGRFDIKTIWNKGINGAQTYIYAEDQAFTSAEIFDWINARVKASTELRVILVMGGNDPTAPSPGVQFKLMRKHVNEHLLKDLNAAQRDRIGIFMRAGKFVHTKSTIVDDHWALIGSANFMRRSLYTDIEHAVGYMDEAGVAVQSYRRDLWGKHLASSPADVNAAIALWFAIPFLGVGAAPPPDAFVRLHLPLDPATLTSEEEAIAEDLLDNDSRQEWGNRLIRLFMERAGAGSFSP